MQQPHDEFHTFGPTVGVGWDWAKGPAGRGKPFRAEFEELHTRKSTNEVLRQKGSVFQDGAGRLRQDYSLPDPEDVSATKHITVIFDAVTLICYLIDQETKEVQKIDLGAVMRGQRAAGQAPGGNSTGCPLPAPARPQRTVEAIPGERIIEGLSCAGTVIRGPSGTTIERWVSSRIAGFPILEKKDTDDLEIVFRLFNIKLEDPDPELFVPPAS